MYLSGELFMHLQDGDVGVYFTVYLTVCQESIYIILFLNNKSINDPDHNNLGTSTPCFTRLVNVPFMMSQLIADDVTMTRQLWCWHMKIDI